MQSNIATATEMKNNFGHYLGIVMGGGQVIVTKQGKEVARMIPKSDAVSFLTDSLKGIITDASDMDRERSEQLEKKHGSTY